jgi:hypothetical protein
MQLDRDDNGDDEPKQVERLLDRNSVEGTCPVACYQLEVE